MAVQRRWILAGVMALAASGAIAWRASDGAVDEQRLRVRGLTAPVEVRRDRWGVPHIYARNTADLFFAQGFVAAQDRLFQMEMWRRAGEGRLAEVLGPAAVERDRFARTFRYRGDMAKEWASYAPDTKAIVTAFVRGVNAYIAMAGDSLPPEFALLGFRPEPWTPEVPLARSTGLSGVSNASSEVLRAELVARLGAARVDALLPAEPARALDPVGGLDLAGISSASLGGFGAAFADVAYNRIEGSNNWTVSGRKTATGMPILANDPHRVITNPAVRYLTHLVAPGWNVIGAGEPASPGVSIGHNERIAFGLTVVGMDQQDVYVETLGACAAGEVGEVGEAGEAGEAGGAEGASEAGEVGGVGGPPQQHTTSPTPTPPNHSTANRTESSLDCYRHNGRWRRIASHRETIRIKGEAPRTVTIRYTVHGPLLSVDSTRKRGIALRSVHTEPGTASYLASLSLDRARNWDEFQQAMSRWLMPSENMIYADVDGNIGWVAGGIMPRRSWSGLLPVPGEGSHEWNGFVPGMELPRAFNPADGFIATANHNILPPGYPIPLAYEWASRYRIDRVREVLRQPRLFSIDDFRQLQHDDRSKLAEALVPHLVDAARRQGAASRPELRLLAEWNLHMSRDQVAPTIFSAWAPAVYRRAITRELADAPDVARTLAARAEYEWLESVLARPSSGATDSLLLGALDDATSELTRRFGADRAKWRYGDIHQAIFRHPLTAKYDLPPASRGGDANTVYATGGRDFKQGSGASFREIIDLANFDRSVVTNVPGQSADPRSRHYGDLLPLWARDEYFPLVYSRARVEQETEQLLWLELPPSPRTR
ncbi:MAG: penicillin acylase family protein [Gemmatimonadaceae bacterium]|nr:penicillin acylase family protein [Gemmatimonadaceae bacterium]